MVTTRFAPSPTGYLHLGHAYAALFGWRAARAAGGRFLLRIENIDTARCQEAFEAALMEDLRWLGIDWDGPVRRQSEHLSEYAAALCRLRELGVLYPCFCTRAEIRQEIERAGAAPHGPDGPLYPGTCRELSAHEQAERLSAAASKGQGAALRLNVARAIQRTGPLFFVEHGRGTGGGRGAGPRSRRVTADPLSLGDVVLARKEVPTSYHLSVTLDDHLQGVSLVTRGEDLFHATHVHRLLQALLDLGTPAYHHHGLLTDEHGNRFAKRNQSVTLRSLRQRGDTSEEILSRISSMSG